MVPGSGVGELIVISGQLLLTIDEDGSHNCDLEHDI
jgi:hypothetical protein